MNEASRPLIRALAMNAIFSATSAVLMLLSADWVAAQVGLPGPADVYSVSVFLLVFAGWLGFIVYTVRIRMPEILLIIAGDLVWVLGSAVLVGLHYNGFTTAGLFLTDAVALAVLTFAVLQIRGLRRYRKGARLSPAATA